MRGAEVRIEGSTVLGPLDLSIGPGERWILLGPNGSGKTTFLALAGARRQPSVGTVTVLGTTLGRGDGRLLHPRIGRCHTDHDRRDASPRGDPAVHDARGVAPHRPPDRGWPDRGRPHAGRAGGDLRDPGR